MEKLDNVNLSVENATERLNVKIAQLQLEIPTLPKDASGYGYKYTTYETVLKALKPLFQAHNLGFCQPLVTGSDGKPSLLTRIIDIETGANADFVTPLPQAAMAKMNEVQAMGATITYFKRYALCSLFGIASDEDVDANTIEYTKPINSKELEEAKAELSNIITAGAFDSDEKVKKAAQSLLNGTNLERINKCLVEGTKRLNNR